MKTYLLLVLVISVLSGMVARLDNKLDLYKEGAEQGWFMFGGSWHQAGVWKGVWYIDGSEMQRASKVSGDCADLTGTSKYKQI